MIATITEEREDPATATTSSIGARIGTGLELGAPPVKFTTLTTLPTRPSELSAHPPSGVMDALLKEIDAATMSP